MSQELPDPVRTEAQSNDHEPDEAEELQRGDRLEPADLSESTGFVLDSSTKITSDALYIVRESNYLFELAEALEEHGIELREEAP